MKHSEHIIKFVEPGSIAEELEVEAGDVLLAINNQEIEDVFDYRCMIKDEYLEVLVRKPDGEEWLLEVDKEYDDDLGIQFENELMSEYRSCTNKCIFCFIDQMPPGMRETLYFKDDDSRLSFMQGNYITLTNMKDKDIDRIIRLHLAPINISVQTTNPELRCKMLSNRFAGEKLKYIQRLYENQIEMNGQIVCCKGVNDGAELKRSIEDLMAYLPYMRSVSVVPAGITKYREGLYPLELFTKEEAGGIIDLIESYQQKCYEEFGLHFIHASDEWYITAEREFPEEDRYDGYIQLENGVGMMRLLKTEFDEALEQLVNREIYAQLKENLHRTVTIATGKLAYPMLKNFAQRLMEHFPGLTVNVFWIRNEFFGETITVSGLVTGQDLVKQLKEKQESGMNLGDAVMIPGNMLRTGEKVFLDDVTTDEVEAALGLKVVAAGAKGSDFIEAVLNPQYHDSRDNGNFVYIQAYDRKQEF
ncbi:MAG: DUF512 domain-containing protein [Lachnospiraceae bacterium]|nr:DUF512 domain-containing protein [Lachnospiraceae bacterium]